MKNKILKKINKKLIDSDNFFDGEINEILNTYSHMYQNRLENIVQIIEVQNTKLLKIKQKKLPEPKETIIDYEDANYYDYDEELDDKKEDDLVL